MFVGEAIIGWLDFNFLNNFISALMLLVLCKHISIVIYLIATFYLRLYYFFKKHFYYLKIILINEFYQSLNVFYKLLMTNSTKHVLVKFVTKILHFIIKLFYL